MNSNGLLFVPPQTTPSETEASSSHFGMSQQQKLGNQQLSRSLFALEFLPKERMALLIVKIVMMMMIYLMFLVVFLMKKKISKIVLFH